MRIAFVTETYPPELNGVALTVERTIRHLRTRGHQVELIRPRQRGEDPLDAPHELRTMSCSIPMYWELRMGLASAGTLRRRFEQTRPQLVHVATEGPLGWAALRAAQALNLPVSSDFRTNFHEYSRYYGLGWLSPVVYDCLRRFHRRTQLTFVPTSAVRESLEAAGFGRIAVVGRGVDTGLFDPAKRSEALRVQWGVGDDAPVLLYVGRLAAEKNVALALCAFEAVRLHVPSARMVVVGDGPARRRLEADFPAVHFAGVQRGEVLAQHYASADLFLFPSLSDTFGNVTLEALASGLPVVAFDAAAAADHVDDCGNGLLVPAGDERAYVAAVCSLAWQHGELTPMREQARGAALRLQWTDVLSRFEAHLADTVLVHASRVAEGEACAA
ncbi:glycosyltransferase family 4 protein [Piscinibacter sp.]|uniref:glycosyltransferase family 4 protein n=1 Tax=Piscinibacter sp. TaxID=1903157 RepID=UPI002BE4CF83|nr:glycosyltransferase family 1 protein [Albitalea sp.]HUG24761.1 glycosyltransferase family 1 protein [Albitalea sp.]